MSPHDMASHSMVMTPTSTSAAAAHTSASMGHDMPMAASCKISMLWNWNTIDACFLSESWHVSSRGTFAGSCIGAIGLVIALEFLRRVQREHTRRIRRSIRDRQCEKTASVESLHDNESGSSTASSKPALNAVQEVFGHSTPAGSGKASTQPTIIQQFVHAGLHMLQFAVAYFLMLLAMSYNGYLIISIIVGAFLGSFLFSWDQTSFAGDGGDADVTGCCG